MPELAINGGHPIMKVEPHPWPIADEKTTILLGEVLMSGRWSFDGPREWEFCERFAELLKVEHCLCVTNGTAALQLALEALNIGAGDEVVVPGLTWQATAAAALDINAVPILVDVDPDTYCIDPDRVREAITDRTRAIVPVHLWCCMADLDSLLEIAEQHGIKVVEDNAHQPGSLWRGKSAGTFGDIGTVSFQESKIITCGEGGAVLTDDDELASRLYSLRNCGRLRDGKYGQPMQSGNYRITELQAAVLLGELSRFERRLSLYDQNSAYLNRRLAEIPGIEPLVRHRATTRQAVYQYVFRYDEESFRGVPRDCFRRALQAELGFDRNQELYVPYEPLNDCSLYRPHTKPRYQLSEDHWKAIDPRRFDLPVSDRAFHEAILLPHWLLLADEERVGRIADACEKIVANLDELARTMR